MMLGPTKIVNMSKFIARKNTNYNRQFLKIFESLSCQKYGEDVEASRLLSTKMLGGLNGLFIAIGSLTLYNMSNNGSNYSKEGRQTKHDQTH